MDWLTFISDIVDSLAWPVGVIFLLLAFKNQIKELIPKLKRAKYKDFEVDFDKEMQGLVTASDEADKELPDEIKLEEFSDKDLDAITFIQVELLVDRSPEEAIEKAWWEIERMLFLLFASATGDYEISRPSYAEHLRRFLSTLTPRQEKVIRELKKIKELVSDNLEPVTTEQALEYVRNASRVYKLLRTKLLELLNQDD